MFTSVQSLVILASLIYTQRSTKSNVIVFGPISEQCALIAQKQHSTRKLLCQFLINVNRSDCAEQTSEP